MRAFLTGSALGPPLLILFLVWSHVSGGASVDGGHDAPPLPRAGVDTADLEGLQGRDLLLPVEGVRPEDLRDSFAETRGSRLHQAIDILAKRGTPVRAVDDGVLRRLQTEARGGLTAYQIDETGTYGYYYAHLDGYAPGLREGASLHKGDVVGYVGSTGNAPRGAPHLHFAIFKLGDGQTWTRGVPVNPFLVLAPRA